MHVYTSWVGLHDHAASVYMLLLTTLLYILTAYLLSGGHDHAASVYMHLLTTLNTALHWLLSYIQGVHVHAASVYMLLLTTLLYIGCYLTFRGGMFMLQVYTCYCLQHCFTY